MKKLIGKLAPDFSLKDQDGVPHQLSSYSGHPVLLYFYPKDDTPGCTVEAVTFEDRIGDFKKRGVVVLGVSPDSENSHKKFCKKYKLSFTLLSDPAKEVFKKYGVWVEKSLYGRKYMGVERDSFLIDKKGKVVAEYQKVKPEEHPDEILKDIKKLKI